MIDNSMLIFDFAKWFLIIFGGLMLILLWWIGK